MESDHSNSQDGSDWVYTQDAAIGLPYPIFVTPTPDTDNSNNSDTSDVKTVRETSEAGAIYGTDWRRYEAKLAREKGIVRKDLNPKANRTRKRCIRWLITQRIFKSHSYLYTSDTVFLAIELVNRALQVIADFSKEDFFTCVIIAAKIQGDENYAFNRDCKKTKAENESKILQVLGYNLVYPSLLWWLRWQQSFHIMSNHWLTIKYIIFLLLIHLPVGFYDYDILARSVFEFVCRPDLVILSHPHLKTQFWLLLNAEKENNTDIYQYYISKIGADSIYTQNNSSSRSEKVKLPCPFDTPANLADPDLLARNAADIPASVSARAADASHSANSVPPLENQPRFSPQAPCLEEETGDCGKSKLLLMESEDG